MLVNNLVGLEFFCRLEIGYDIEFVLEFGRVEFVFWLLLVSIFSSDIDEVCFK